MGVKVSEPGELTKKRHPCPPVRPCSWWDKTVKIAVPAWPAGSTTGYQAGDVGSGGTFIESPGY